MTEIRVLGLVRLMHWVQAQMQAGLSPARAEALRATIFKSLQQVDGLLQRYHAAPSDLPRPSLQAYQYLKTVDLQQLPPPKPAANRITGLIGLCQAIQDKMLACLTALRKREPTAQDELLGLIRSGLAELDAICAKSHLQPQDLPAPSRRAAAWLNSLADPATLALHLNAVERLDRFARQALKNPAPVRVTFFNQSALFRVNRSAGGSELAVHAGYIGAPDEVLAALAGAALSQRTDRRMQLVRAYSTGPDFLARARRLADADGSAPPAPAGGSHHSLDAAFARVNRDYFGGSLARPTLTWSRRATYREFGHYQPSTDTVSISRSLDALSVPEYVLDFVVYHELLHKHLGIKTAGGRQYAHTPEFHQAERCYPHCQEAKDFLQALSRQLSPHRQNSRNVGRID
ncbi:MAG TPA: SprT-like domain-containing protein [Anaerolineaceae bacterium]